MHDCTYAIVSSELFLYVCTFPCVVTVFILFVIAKSMSTLFHCCILAFFGLCSYVCTRLFVCLVGWFFCVLTLHIYSQVYLIFSGGFVICLIVFFGQIIYFCIFCFLQVFLGDTCAFFWYFWLHNLSVFVWTV